MTKFYSIIFSGNEKRIYSVSVTLE